MVTDGLCILGFPDFATHFLDEVLFQDMAHINEDEHRHFHINIFQTFLAWLHEQGQILNKLLRHVG